jgi:adenosylhomocysteine nucleosidase
VNKPAIIVALEREIAPLVRDPLWCAAKLIPSAYRNYESSQGFIVCSGIGGLAARTAAERIIRQVSPSILISAGVAGSLTPQWKVGDVIAPAAVVQSPAGTPRETVPLSPVDGLQRGGTLVSTSSVAGLETKAHLAREYQADVVDMEAASVAEIAAAHDIPFAAVKAISDEYDFPVPELGRFVATDGKFLTSRFILYSMLRPKTWSVVSRLASNTNKASQQLCRVLRTLLASGAFSSAVPR